ncbi:unnamed protein product [Trichobilharzia szidati]|nr:unnamed protein product [Trichobilharzia szidati]
MWGFKYTQWTCCDLFFNFILLFFVSDLYNADVCADCNAPSPQWASVNRGVLLCDECSSIHRQLGRHISQIKHLKKSRWRPSQLSMVRYLASAGANGYWEHILYEPMLSGPNADHHRLSKSFQPHKKPLPSDPVHPTKADFIREKYLFLGFFKKPRNINQDDLNQQLHASVRTGVLETSLYLLALGANPNFLHPTKGTAPIHVACQYGQIGQVELLLAYGADVCIRDSSGKTVIDLALDKALALNESMSSKNEIKLMRREEKLQLAWSSMVDLLVSAYYDLTDSLAYFLTRHIPDHRAAFFGIHRNNPTTKSINLHSNIPGPTTTTTNGQENDQDDWIVEARGRLSKLSNLAFSDLCIDVYDEADRRLTNSFLENIDTFKGSKHSHNYSVFNGCHSDKSVLHNGGSSSSNNAKESTSVPIPPPHRVTTLHQTTNSASVNLTLFFLPPNTNYSSVRNQARQKLGRLSTIEFHTLTLDVLTEASIRLLPLFLPLSHVNTMEMSLNEMRKLERPRHSYIDYNNSAEYYHQSHTVVNDYIGSHRNVPLPSIPSSKTTDPDLIDDSEQHLHSTNSSSSHESLCDNEADKKSNNNNDHFDISPIEPEDLSEQENSQILTPSSPSVEKTKKALTKKTTRLGRSRDDPVYDQVAGEVDINDAANNCLNTTQTIVSSSSPAVSLSSTDQTALSVNVQTTNMNCEDNGRQNLTETLLIDNSNSSLASPISPIDGKESSRTRQQHKGVDGDGVDDDESDSTGPMPPITSRPGPVPGSRRLHLSHTGRIVQHRASVPTTNSCITTTASTMSDTSNNSVSVADSTVNLVKSSEQTKNTTLHSLINVYNTENTNGVAQNHLNAHHLHHHPEPCCIAARNEVERLRKENTELKTQLSDLQSSKNVVEQRLEDLEGRMIQLDSVVQALKEEKSALLAAFSAGMVMVHNPLKSGHSKNQPVSSTSTTTASTAITAATTTTAAASTNSPHLKATKSTSSIACDKDHPASHSWDYEKEEEDEDESIGEDINEVIRKRKHDQEISEADIEQYKDDDSEYDMERVGGDKSISEGNYAVGSQCLDSGVLLRQGIILRGSRGESPASVSGLTHQSGFGHSHAPMPQPTVTPSFRNSVQNTKLTDNNECGQRQSSVFTSTNQVVVSSTSQNLPAYINAPNLVQHSASKTKAALVSNATVTFAEASHTDLPDDYTAPNATGSPSPAPIPISQSLTPASSSHRIITSGVNVNIPGGHHHHHPGKSSFLPNSRLNKPTLIEGRKQLHHTEVLVSMSKSSPDYDNASRSSSSSTTTTHSSNESSFHPSGKPLPGKHNVPTGIGSGDQVWKAPSSERVVRCVETIIMRIRNLVEFANGDRRGNTAHCSRLIQSAIQDLLNLFPPHELRPVEVESALNDLASESQNLRKHCEQLSSASDGPDRFEIMTSTQTSKTTVHNSNTGSNNNSRPVPTEITVLIRHAHHIARAAKDLLSLFQRIDQ